MNTLQMVYVAGIFAMVTGIAWTLLSRFSTSNARKRLGSVVGSAAYGDNAEETWLETIVKLAAPIARLSAPKEGWENSPLRLRFISAGYRGENAATLFFAAKTALALLLAVLSYLWLRVAGGNLGQSQLAFVLLIATALGYYLPSIVLNRLVAWRKLEVFENFPDAADLMLVCIESGLGLDSALTKVAEEIRLKSPPLSDELHLLNLEMRAGNSREKSLRNLALRTGVEEVGVFATMLIQADRFGTSIGASLRVFSDELRTKRNMRAEEVANKVPLKMLFPLVFCIFPALMLVLLGPAMIQVYRILLPMMGGQH